MGTVEEGSKIIQSVVEALKTRPTMLIMLIINLTLLAFIWFIAVEVHETRKREFATIFKNQEHIQELLARCKI